MQPSGRSSWEFRCTSGANSPLSRALFVRDSCALPVAECVSLPPRLIGLDRPTSTMLEASERDEAADQWLQWWTATVDLHVRLSGGYVTARQCDWRRQLDLPSQDVGAGPGYEGLADRPALQKAVLLAVSGWRQWVEAETRRCSTGMEEPYWPQVREIAEAVIADRQVEPHLVRGLVFTLPVTGTWWSRWSPGVVLCARSAACVEDVEGAILRDAFLSSVC